MSRNLYMNLYVQQIFNQEPCKKWFGDTTHNICFSNALQERKTWNFFLSDYILVDVRHFVGFLFRPYGKKTIQQAIYFPRSCVRILTEYRTCHLTYQLNIFSINLILGHVTSSVPYKNSSVCFFEVSFVYKCLCRIFMYSTWWQFSCKCWVYRTAKYPFGKRSQDQA